MATAWVKAARRGAASQRVVQAGHLVGVGALLLAIAVWTQIHFLRVPHCYDDAVHLEQISLVHDGRLPLARWLATPHNEHLVPLWKLWYLAMWRAFGLAPAPWHACLALLHAGVGLLTYVWARRYLGWGPALAGACLWCGAAFGQVDNPAAWIGASHLNFGFAALLLSLEATTGLDGPHPRRSYSLMAGGIVASGLLMGAMVFLAALLPVAYVLLEGGRRRWWAHRAGWLLAWLLPCLLIFGLQLALVLWPSLGALRAQGREIDVLKSLVGTLSTTAVSLASLVYWPIGDDPTSTGRRWLAIAAVAAVACVALVGRRPQGPAFVAVVNLLAFSYTLIAYLGRSHVPNDLLLGWARYCYLPVWAWCLTLAAMLAALPHPRRGVPRTGWQVAWVALGVVFLWQQARRADELASLIELIQRPRQAVLDDYRRLLSQASQSAEAADVSLRLPNIRLDVPTLDHSLSRWATIAFPGGLPQVSVVDAAELSRAEIAQLRSWLMTIRSTSAKRILEALEPPEPAARSPHDGKRRGPAAREPA